MLKAGQKFAHFEIVRLLGEGGMGEVYLAEDQKLRRKVALKILLEEYYGNSEHAQRMEREARTAARIQNQYVMSIYDFGTATDPETGRDIRYIVMEFIEGQSLTDYMDSVKLDYGRMIRLAERIAVGLAAAHKMEVVHRDIKAENIIVDADGQPKILDFGLAKPVEPIQFEDKGDAKDTISKELTKVGKIVGTVSYMSPEQARGDQVDARSDIFSFGSLLYRMAGGKLPFQSDSQLTILARILETPHQPLNEIDENIPAEFVRIIDKCLQKDRVDRYQDTRDLVVDLRSLRRQSDSGFSTTVSQTTRINKVIEVKASVILKPLLAVAAIIVVGYFVYSSFFGSGESVIAGDSSLAIVGFSNMTGDAELDWMETGLSEIMLTDLSQQQSLSLIGRERIVDRLSPEKRANYTVQDCIDIARELGALYVLSGTYYKVGDKIRIDARLEDLSSGRIVLGEKVIGSDPFVLVDSLTHKIAQSLNVSDSLTSDESVAQFTSSSPEAYRLYLEGVDLFFDQKFDESIVLFEQALAIDSTFALPYMRIGMAHAWQGRQQAGTEYFRMAQKYKPSLPARDRSLLSVYSDMWLDQKFDDGFTKLAAFVSTYPDDKEARTIYGALLFGFSNDSTRSFAQLDTALQLDADFPLAMSIYVTYYRQLRLFEPALERAEAFKEAHSDVYRPYLSVASLYIAMSRYEDAAEEYEIIVKKFPDYADALAELSTLMIRMRQFEKAQEYLEKFRRTLDDDPFARVGFNTRLANLATWRGELTLGIGYYKDAYRAALRTNDSGLVGNRLSIVARTYRNYGQLDSAYWYNWQADGYAGTMNKLDFPLVVSQYRPELGDSLRPSFDKALAEFRTRIPSDLWPIVDGIEIMFEGRVASDTAKVIEGMRLMIETQSKTAGYRNRFNLAKLLILSGRLEEGVAVLDEAATGSGGPTDAYLNLMSRYYRGLASEGLGDQSGAIEHYQELLNYWGKADLQLDEIVDARNRLARLTS